MRERGEEDRSHPHFASVVGQGILRMMLDQNEKHTDPWALQGLLSWTLWLDPGPLQDQRVPGGEGLQQIQQPQPDVPRAQVPAL